MKRKLAILVLLVCSAAAAGCDKDEKTIWILPPIVDPTGGFADSGTFLDTIYVATTGSSTGDGTLGNPHDDLVTALLYAAPGDTVRLLPGTYPGGGYVSNLKGTAVNPVLITGGAASGTTITGGGANGIQLSDPEYVIIQDLTIDSVPYNGMNIDDGSSFNTPAHHIVIRRVTVSNIGTGGNQDGLKLSGVDYFLIEECDISYCGGGLEGSGIDMVGCHHGAMRANYLHHAYGNAIQAKGGSEDILIWQNWFYQAGERSLNLGGSTDPLYFRPQGANYEARNLRVLVNIFDSCKAPICFVGCDGALAANNTIYLPRTWVARILQESVTGYIPCRNGRFVNNIIYFNQVDLSTYVNVGPDTASTTFTFSNNLWHCHDNPSFTGPTGLPVTETASIYQQDPLFNNPAAGEFWIDNASPARGEGAFQYEVPADYSGKVYENPPSIGAYEGTP